MGRKKDVQKKPATKKPEAQKADNATNETAEASVKDNEEELKIRQEKQKKHNNQLNWCAFCFIVIYVAITIPWIHISLKYGIDNNFLNWQNYVCMMLLIGVIHVWIYAFLKFKQSRDELNGLFKSSPVVYKDILDDYDNLLCIISLKRADKTIDIPRAFFKIAYPVLWVYFCYKICTCTYNLHLYGIGDADHTGLFTFSSWVIFFSLIAGMGFNFVSYYFSMAFCFFTRELANAQNLSCECENPWNSKDLRQLIKMASRSSMSFFVVSMMYMAVVSIGLLSIEDFNTDEMKYVTMLLVLTTFLCVFSFILFAILPKLFLNRRFRYWKFEKVKDLDDKNPTDAAKIEKIWSSNLPYVRMETVMGLFALAINLGGLIVNIFKLVLSVS